MPFCAGFIDQGQLGGQFPILAVFGIPLQWDGQPNRKHVGKGRAALGIAGLDAPVGPFVGLGQPRLGLGGVDLGADRPQIRVLLEVFARKVILQRYPLPWRRPGGRSFGNASGPPTGPASVRHCGTGAQSD